MPLAWPDAQHLCLSPHLDDAVLSCGGMIAQRAARGESVAVITVFAASPPDPGALSGFARELHERWRLSAPAGVDFSDPPAVRREEDRRACAALGVSIAVIHYSLADCIYRSHVDTGQPLYDSERALFGAPRPGDPALADLAAAPPPPPAATLYAPLALGGHVDHRIVRQAVESWGIEPSRLWHYEDYPYAALQPSVIALEALRTGWRDRVVRLDEAALAAKVEAISQHASQISTFWDSRQAMEEAVRAFARQRGGERLWRRV